MKATSLTIVGSTSIRGRLKQLDRITIRIFQLDLPAGGAGFDFISKMESCALHRRSSTLRTILFHPPGSCRLPSGRRSPKCLQIDVSVGEIARRASEKRKSAARFEVSPDDKDFFRGIGREAAPTRT